MLQFHSAAAESASALRPLDEFQAPIKTFSQATSVNSKRGALAKFRIEFAGAVAAQQEVVAGCRQALDALEDTLRTCTETAQTRFAGVTAAEQVCEKLTAGRAEKEQVSQALVAADAAVNTLLKTVDTLNDRVAEAEAAEPQAQEFEAEAKRRQQLQGRLDEHLQHQALAAAWAAAQTHRTELEQQLQSYATLEHDIQTHSDELRQWKRQADEYATAPLVDPLAEVRAALTQLGKETKAMEQQQAHLRQEHLTLVCPTCGAPMTAAQRRQRQSEVSVRLTQLASDTSATRARLSSLEQQQREWSDRRVEVLRSLEEARTKCDHDQQRQSACTVLEDQLSAARQKEASALDACHSRGVTPPLDPSLERQLRAEIKASASQLELLEEARATFKQLEARLKEVQMEMERLADARRDQLTCQEAHSAIAYDEEGHRLAEAALTAAREEHTAARLAEVSARNAVNQGKQRWTEARSLEEKLNHHEREIDQNARQLAREERLAEHLTAFQRHFFSVNVRAVMIRASQLIAPATSNAIRALELDPDAALHYWDQFKQRHDAKRLSGGEQALVGLCIRLALAERAQTIIQGSRVKFLILDEVLGSLDEERRTAVQGILANVLDQGAFEYVVMITHLDEVKHNWDAHRLEVRLDRTSGMSSVAVLDSTWPA